MRAWVRSIGTNPPPPPRKQGGRYAKRPFTWGPPQAPRPPGRPGGGGGGAGTPNPQNIYIYIHTLFASRYPTSPSKGRSIARSLDRLIA